MTQTIDNDVARHYTHGSLESAILAGLSDSGDVSHSTLIDRLAAVDEFHIGGRQATADLAAQLELQPGLSVLDVGCGIGGTARFLALRCGCRVTGVDLTPEFVDVGNRLNRRVGLHEQIDFRLANATDLPFDDASFDRVTLLHVGMNIPDKRWLCAEIGRVIKPGGLFGLYDIMRIEGGSLVYPVPWAQIEARSFVHPPEDYRRGLQKAGFEIIAERNRREFALEFFRTMKARVAEAGPPPLGLHILMGTDAAPKVTNMIDNLERGCIAPVEIIARRV